MRGWMALGIVLMLMGWAATAWVVFMVSYFLHYYDVPYYANIPVAALGAASMWYGYLCYKKDLAILRRYYANIRSR